MKGRALFAGSLWLAAVVYGCTRMAVREATPGSQGMIPAVWPAESSIPREPGAMELLLFAHPRCSCTRGAINILERLKEEIPAAHIRVLTWTPSGQPWKLTSTMLPQSADPDGREAARFGVETSGHSLLYDAHGKLLWHGGLSAFRGADGEGAAVAGLRDLLQSATDRPPALSSVFGCSLLDGVWN